MSPLSWAAGIEFIAVGVAEVGTVKTCRAKPWLAFAAAAQFQGPVIDSVNAFAAARSQRHHAAIADGGRFSIKRGTYAQEGLVQGLAIEGDVGEVHKAFHAHFGHQSVVEGQSLLLVVGAYHNVRKQFFTPVCQLRARLSLEAMDDPRAA